MKDNTRLQWFKERVGKRVFRNKNGCDCPSCEVVYKTGVVITDQFHANYLYDLEKDFSSEGEIMRYFDTKEEVEQFEKI